MIWRFGDLVIGRSTATGWGRGAITKSPNHQITKWLAGVTAAALAVAVVAALAAESGSIAARVNGTPISTDMVDRVVRDVIASRPKPPDSDEIARLTQSALDSLIDLELLYQEAQAREIRVSDKEVDAEIARTRARFANRSQFESALKASGLSEQRLREDTRKTLMVNRLLATMPDAKTPVPADAVDRFYEEHRAQLKPPAEVRVSEIVIRVPAGSSVTDRSAALDRAHAVLAELRAGGDFATLARTRSDDQKTAGRGGDLGFVHRGELPAAIDAVVFSLPPGEVSEVLEGSDGYHIIMVTQTQAVGSAPPGELREQIARMLEGEARQQRQAALVKTLREKAKIEVPGAE